MCYFSLPFPTPLGFCGTKVHNHNAAHVELQCLLTEKEDERDQNGFGV